MNVGDYLRVKDDHAFHDIRGKKCRITSRPSNTSVYVQIENSRWGATQYLFEDCELEPWEEPKPKSKPVPFMKMITIGYLTQTYWFFNMTEEQAIDKWLELEDEKAIPPHISIEHHEIHDNIAVAYSGPYGSPP